MITKLFSRKKEQTALALAVSLWMANGGVASAQDTVIERDLFIGDAYGGKAERCHYGGPFGERFPYPVHAAEKL